MRITVTIHAKGYLLGAAGTRFDFWNTIVIVRNELLIALFALVYFTLP